MRSLHLVAAIGVSLLLAGNLPAHAGTGLNALTANALTNNALSNNALTAAGSAMSDLNGVAVEELTLPAE